MKILNVIIITFVILHTGLAGLFPQESTDNMQLLDLKLQLLDSKLELLDSKIKIWETKPQELDIRLSEIDDRLQQLDFNPEELNRQFLLIDSLLQEYERITDDENYLSIPEYQERQARSDSIQIPPRKYYIALNPVRVVEGTLEVFVERVINKRNTIEISGMATYASEQGLSGTYLKNQELSYYNDAISSYDSYRGDNISGFGLTLSWKNYLMPAINPRYAALKGLYAAPYTMFRKVWIAGIDQVYSEEEDLWKTVEITQKLNILAGGVILGWQFPIAHVISVDVFLGGVIRLCHYDGESGATKYKRIDNIDYSGVLPRAGIKIGILK